MPRQHQRYFQRLDESQLSPKAFNPYAYVPVDPFKPSIAFSLRKLSAEEDTNLLEDNRSPLHQLPSQGQRAGASGPHNRAYGWTRRPPAGMPAGPTIPHDAEQMAAHLPSAAPSPEAYVGPAGAYVPPVSQSWREYSRSPPRASFSLSAPPSCFEGPPPHSPGSLGRTSRPSSYHTPHGHSYAQPSAENYSARLCTPPSSKELAYIASEPSGYSEPSGPSNHSFSTRSRRPPHEQLSRSPSQPSHSPVRGRHMFRSSHLSTLPDAVSPSTAESLFEEISMSNPTDLPYFRGPIPVDTSSLYRQAFTSTPPPVSHLPNPQRRYHLGPPAISATDHPSNVTVPQPKTRRYLNFELSPSNYVAAFLIDTLPRQIYLNLLLRLPYLYFSRVTRIFEEAEMSMPMIRQGILETARANARAKGESGFLGQSVQERVLGGGWGMELEPAMDNVGYINLQTTWLAFVDSLLKEWKTLNIISVLLLSAILTILQIESAASDPLTRYSALLSMICALISLVYGCIYIIRFGTMKKTYKGAAWAQEAQKRKAGIWWNIWVMLALPATWLAWSLILYVTTITAFIWRTSPFQIPISSSITTTSTAPQLIIPRLLITTVLSLGIIYFILVVSTLRRYGETMDRAWQERVWAWMQSVYNSETVEANPITNIRPESTFLRPENRDCTRDVGSEKESYEGPQIVIRPESTRSRDRPKPIPLLVPAVPAPTFTPTPQSEDGQWNHYGALTQSNLELLNLQNIDTFYHSNLMNYIPPDPTDPHQSHPEDIHERSDWEDSENNTPQVVRLPGITVPEPAKSALFKGGRLNTNNDQINGGAVGPIASLPRLALETLQDTINSNEDLQNPKETVAFNGGVPEVPLTHEVAHLKSYRHDFGRLSTIPSIEDVVDVVTDTYTTPEKDPNSEHLKLVADDENREEGSVFDRTPPEVLQDLYVSRY